MNEEITNFVVKFVTEGLKDVKDGLKDITKSVDTLTDSFNKHSEKGDSFFEKLAGWTLSLGGLAAGFYAVKEAMEAVEKTASGIRQTYKAADLVGVDPETMERWNIATWFYTEGETEAKSAVKTFFSGLNDLEQRLKELKLSDAEEERMSHLGFSMAYLHGAGLPANRTETISKIRDVYQRKDLDAADLQAFQKVFNIPEAMIPMFKLSSQGWQDLMNWAEGLRVETKDPATLEASIRSHKVDIEFTQMWKEVKADLIEPMADLKEAIIPLKDPIKDISKQLVDVVKTLTPIAGAIMTVFGDGLATIGNFIKMLRGQMTWDEFVNSALGTETGKDVSKTTEEFLNKDIKDVNWVMRPLKTVADIFTHLPSMLRGDRNKNSVDVNSNMTIDLNGERFTNDSFGNIRSEKTGEIVGNIYAFSTAKKG